MPEETAAVIESPGAEGSTLSTTQGDTNQGAGSGSSQAGDQGDEAAIELLGREAYDKVRDDPAALSKALHRSYTQKTQALATHRDFIEAWREDPQAVLTRMAQQYGFDLQPRKDEKEEVTQSIVDKLAGVMGDEAAQSLTELIKTTVESVFESKVGPLRESTETLEMQTALEQVNALEERFEAKYPDYRQFEAQMEALGKELLPNGMDPFKYMENLYKLAKSDANVADEARKIIQRRDNAARGSERATTGVPPHHVANAPVGADGKLSFEAAAQAALKGQTFDPDEIRRLKRERRNAK